MMTEQATAAIAEEPPVPHLPQFEIAIDSDGSGAEIRLNGEKILGVTKYTIEHKCGELALVTLTYFADVKISGKARRKEQMHR